MTAGHIIYPLIIVIMIAVTAINRESRALRILVVCLLTGFTIAGMKTIPGTSVRSALDTRTNQRFEDFRDGAIATA